MAVYFVSPELLPNDEKREKPIWADPEHGGNLPLAFKKELWERVTYYPHGVQNKLVNCIDFDCCNRPLNPTSPMTNIIGRGNLGKWGPNHAADPIVIRKYEGKYYVLVVKRSDTKEYALPGGMVDPGETLTVTVVRELLEEAADGSYSDLLELFNAYGKIVYKGINEKDPRNTWNAWMETACVAVLVPESFCKTITLRPQFGETLSSRWMRIESDAASLYSDHGTYILRACSELNISYTYPFWRILGFKKLFLDDEINLYSIHNSIQRYIMHLMYYCLIIFVAALVATFLAFDSIV